MTLQPIKKPVRSFLPLVIGLLVIANCASRSAPLSPNVPSPNASLAESSSATTYRVRQEASQLFFLNNTAGWAISKGIVYRTLDGGDSWLALHTFEPTHSIELIFANQHEGWATVNEWSGQHRHLVLRTGDGGRTWSKQLNLESPIYRIDFVDDRTGFVRDRWDDLRQTSDRGKTWEPLGFPEGETHLGLFEGLQYSFFITEKEGWGYGTSIWHTSDGAKTWSKAVADERIRGVLRSAAFVDSKHGWIVGSGREVWRMTDGSTWQPAENVPPPQGSAEEISRELPSDLSCVSFINDKEGWIAANDKTVLYSSDGGANWVVVSRLSTNLSALRFLTNTTGWAIDYDGHLLKTTDAGRSWKMMPTLAAD